MLALIRRARSGIRLRAGLDQPPAAAHQLPVRPDALFVTDPALDHTLVAVQPRTAQGGTLGGVEWTHRALRWSVWRRRQQARARTCRYRRAAWQS
jgi:hypothetical protein